MNPLARLLFLPQALRHSVRHTLAGLALSLGALAAPSAQAAVTSYTVTGHFTGHTSDDATLIAAIAPLLGAGQSLSLQLSLDTATPASGVTPGLGATMYPAITASSARFAGFDDATSSACTGASDFICSVHIESGLGGFADPDRVSVFPSILRSAALESASGLGRLLGLQAMMFFTDFSGSAFGSDALDLDLSTLSLSGWTGQFGVFMLRDGGGFDRASFEFSVDSFQRDQPGDARQVPEPESLALSLLALCAAGLRQLRKTPRAAVRSAAAGLAALTLSLPALALPLVSAEASLLTLINDARSNAGLGTLSLNSALRDAALAHSLDMAAAGNLSPISSDGTSIFDRLNDAGFSANPFSPSAMFGAGPGSDPTALFGLWMADSVTGPMLVAPSATEIGIGLGLDGGGAGYWTVVLNPVQASPPGGGGGGGGSGSGGGGSGGGTGPAPTIDPLACGAGLGLLDRAQCLLNELRLRLGLGALDTDDALSSASAAHSRDMQAHNVLDHTGSDGSFFTDRADRAGYDGSLLGEVIAQGFSGLDSVLLAWLDEPGHRDVLLNPLADEFGLGLEGSGRGSYWTLMTGIDAASTGAAVPEPASLALALLALAGLAHTRRKPLTAAHAPA